MSMNLRRTAALLRPICPPKLELASLGGIRLSSGAICHVKRLEAQGLPTNQAETVTSVICEVLGDNLQSAVHSMQNRSELLQDLKLSNFKLEVQNSYKHRLSLLEHENEKLKDDIENIRSEIRSYTREILTKQHFAIMEATTKLDRDINALRAQMEATKFDVVKYCVGTMFCITAVCLALAM